MHTINLLYSLHLNDNLIIADKIGNKYRGQFYTVVFSMQLNFSLVWNPLVLQLYLKSILIDFLRKATSKISVYSHCCADNLV